VVVLAGIVAMTFGTQTSLIGGGGLIGAGLSVALISWLYRLGTESDEEREAEDRARRYFARYGRWPN
jgi:high-affinity Fe2+/Pb2+ permease